MTAAAADVTVVIPVWDGYVEFLPRAVASAQEAGARLVVVDNASRTALPPLPGVTVARAERRLSTGAARNLGLGLVATPLVVFLDADDVMVPGALALLAEGLVAHPDAVAYAMAIVDGETGHRHRSPRPVAARLAGRRRLFALANATWSLLPTQGATIIRTSEARAAGGYADRSQGEDWVLSAALAWRGPVRFDPRPALVYHWRADSPGRHGRPAANLIESAACVRARLRSGHGLPSVARYSTLLVAPAQWLAIGVARPLFLALRRRRANRLVR